MTSDFVKVRQGRSPVVPEFIRCLAAKCRCCGEIGEISRSNTELIPEGGRCVAGQPYGPGFPKDRPMDMFGTTILGRHIGGSDEVVDTIG